MKRELRLRWWLFLVALIFSVKSAAAQVDGRTLVVNDTAGAEGLAAALAQAVDGDTIEVVGGVYNGPIVVDRGVTLTGRNWPVIDGNGQDTVLKLTAPGTTVTGFLIRNSGDSLDEENAGIAVEASDVVVENNRLEETLFGIYLRQASGSILRRNEIHSKDVPVPRRGDPIRVWYSDDVTIESNVVEKGRDVVLWYSQRLVVRGNQIGGGRYGLHFMYCDDALIEYNRLLHNSVGAYLMYSRRMVLQHNTVAANRGPSGYGVGLKDMDDAIVRNNLFLDNRVGAFLDNSPREVDSTGRFEGNVFAYNDIGVSMLPSVRHNAFSGNSFVENQQQVAVAGGGQLQDNAWTVAGRGNYWSDYAGYDGDGDGLGDVNYKAERLFENMMDRQPVLRLFLYSPSANAVDFAARAFPIVKPQPKLVDDLPLMAPILPQDVPELPAPTGQQLGWLSLALVALAATIAWLPQLQPGSPAFSRLRLNRRPPKARFLNRDTTGDKPMIEVTNLTKRFGGLTAVDNLTFTATPGEAVALWGVNGAGKTTALRCLLNLIPYDGCVTVGGLNARRQSKAVRHLIGFVPQELTFHDDLSVEETLLFYARLKKVEDGFDFEPLLKRLALWLHLAKPVRDLSGGLKQRLALAIALLNDPPLLVLDEPTSNLDVQARGDFLALLLELKRSGKTLLFSSHRPEEVMTLADRVLVLADGCLVANCPPAELSQQLGQQTTWRLEIGDWRLNQSLIPNLQSLGIK